MGLVVWLPLNGNLNNQGLSNVTVTNNGATVDDNGKIGKCYSFDGNTNYISISSTELFNCFKGGSTQFSIAVWVYNGETSGSRAVLFGDHGTTGAINSNIEINGLNQNDSARFYWGSGNVNWGASNSILAVNSWTHLVITYDGTKLNIYINGVLTDTKTTTLSTLNKTTGAFYLGRDNRTGATAFKGMLNDFRVYDHCLSPKEVKEISQGLVLHYKMDDWAMVRSKCSNITWNQLAGIYVNNRPTEASVTNNNGKTRITITSFTSSSSRYIETTLNSYRTIVGHKYYIGCPCYFTGGFYARYNIGNGWKNLSTSNGNPISRVELCETAYTMTNTSLGIVNQTSPGVGDYAEFYGNYAYQFIDLTQMFGAGNEPTLEEFELMFPLPYYPYDAGTVKNLTLPVTDCSGYNYNGTITGILTLDSNTPRYDYSTYFDGDNAPYISRNSLTSEIQTLSAWVKTTKNKSTYQMVVFDNLSQMCISFYSGYIVSYCGPQELKDDGSQCKLDNAYKENDWNHIVVVKTGVGTRKTYCNGVEQTQTSSNWWSAGITGFRIGNRDYSSSPLQFYGYISDVRAYTTQLSEQDILALYHNSASIDKNSNMYTFEYKETDNNSVKVKKNGTTENYSIVEDNTITNASFSKTGTIKAKTFYEK